MRPRRVPLLCSHRGPMRACFIKSAALPRARIARQRAQAFANAERQLAAWICCVVTASSTSMVRRHGTASGLGCCWWGRAVSLAPADSMPHSQGVSVLVACLSTIVGTAFAAAGGSAVCRGAGPARRRHVPHPHAWPSVGCLHSPEGNVCGCRMPWLLLRLSAW